MSDIFEMSLKMNYDINDIQISNPTIEKIRKQLLNNNITSEILLEWAEKAKTPLQNLAFIFIKKATEAIFTIQNNMTIMQLWQEANENCKKGVEGSATLLILNIDNSGLEFQNTLAKAKEAVLAQEKFSEELKKYLNLKTIILYTPYTDSLHNIASPFIYLLGSFRLILHQSAKSEAGLEASIKQLDKLVKEGKVEKINISEKIGIEQAQYLEKVYSTFIYDYNFYTYDHSPSHLILMNLGINGWAGIWLSTQGPIIEAYHRAIYDTTIKKFTGAIYPKIPLWDMLLFARLIEQLDSTPGFLDEDIMTEMVAYASKMGSAGPPGFQASINIATLILNSKNNLIDKKEILLYLQDYAKKIRKNDGLIRHAVFFVTQLEMAKIMSTATLYKGDRF